MVFPAITPAGLATAVRAAAGGDVIWCGADAMGEAAFDASAHSNLTRFTHESGGRRLLADAVKTIREHHPGEAVSIEAAE